MFQRRDPERLLRLFPVVFVDVQHHVAVAGLCARMWFAKMLIGTQITSHEVGGAREVSALRRC
jgi:hypothetical protein